MQPAASEKPRGNDPWPEIHRTGARASRRHRRSGRGDRLRIYGRVPTSDDQIWVVWADCLWDRKRARAETLEEQARIAGSQASSAPPTGKRQDSRERQAEPSSSSQIVANDGPLLPVLSVSSLGTEVRQGLLTAQAADLPAQAEVRAQAQVVEFTGLGRSVGTRNWLDNDPHSVCGHRV